MGRGLVHACILISRDVVEHYRQEGYTLKKRVVEEYDVLRHPEDRL